MKHSFSVIPACQGREVQFIAHHHLLAPVDLTHSTYEVTLIPWNVYM
jgi:hypothetical protein